MTFPYASRIMARIGTDEPIELARFDRHIHPHDLAYWRKEMSPIWKVWAEKRTPDFHFIGRRRAA